MNIKSELADRVLSNCIDYFQEVFDKQIFSVRINQPYIWTDVSNEIVTSTLSVVRLPIVGGINYFINIPNLIVHILNAKEDNFEHYSKMLTYEQVGVPEVWKVDVVQKEIYIYDYDEVRRKYVLMSLVEGGICDGKFVTKQFPENRISYLLIFKEV